MTRARRMTDTRLIERWWPVAEVGTNPGARASRPHRPVAARRGSFAGGTPASAGRAVPGRKAPWRLVRRICGQRSNSVRSSFQLMTDLRFLRTEPKRRGSERSA